MFTRKPNTSQPNRLDARVTLLAALSFMPPGAALAQVVTTCPSELETTQLFSYSGAPATFTVPANVNQVRFIAVGADGGEIPGATSAGGAGARAEGTFAVAPGQAFTVIAGQSPTGANDFESGGGGASGAYFGTTGNSLALVAGGGGGDDNTATAAGAGAGGATSAGGNSGASAGGTCPDGGLGGTGGAGGEFGERDNAGGQGCQNGNGGGGGGGFLSAGEDSAVLAGAHIGPRGGARCSITGAAGGLGASEPGNGGGAGGFGLCGGGGADDRESGGGGGYSGGGGGPESAYPGGGGSFVAVSAISPVLVAGGTAGRGGGSGRNGSVRACYTTRADLSITKTNTPTSGPTDLPTDMLAPGASVNYSIVVTNLGPSSAGGAVVRDPASTGLTCTTAVCGSAVNGAVCPSETGPALVTALQSAAGASIPTLPANGAVTITLSCDVAP
jgi:uncharacterized repeat protein (TIGR01451 family)